MPVNYTFNTKTVQAHTFRHKKLFLFDIDCTLYPPSNKLTHNIITGIVKYHNAICPQKEFLGTLFYNKYGHTLKGYLKEVEGATVQQWVDHYENKLSIYECLERDEELIKMIKRLGVLKIECDEKGVDSVLDFKNEFIHKSNNFIMNSDKNEDSANQSAIVDGIYNGTNFVISDSKNALGEVSLDINTSDIKVETEKCNFNFSTNYHESSTNENSFVDKEIILTKINMKPDTHDNNKHNNVRTKNIEIFFNESDKYNNSCFNEKFNSDAIMENKNCVCEINEKDLINVSKTNSNAIKHNLLSKKYNKETRKKICDDNDIHVPLECIDNFDHDIGMYAFTNASLSVAQKQLDALGIKLDGILCCEYTNDGDFLCKPDEEIYDFVENLFGLKEKDIFLFEDREINLTPAKKRNWNTFFISEENDIKKQLELILVDFKK
ncbi:hypothetical protein COBT_001838 [Conglomerata obtusa]